MQHTVQSAFAPGRRSTVNCPCGGSQGWADVAPHEGRRDSKFPVEVEQLQSEDLKGFDNSSFLLDFFKVQTTQLSIKLSQEPVLCFWNLSAQWRRSGTFSLCWPCWARLWRFVPLPSPSSPCNMVTWLTSYLVPQLPSTDSAGVAADSRIHARDQSATVWAVDCADDGPWGSANDRRLKQFADQYSSESGIAYGIPSGKQNRCYQLACLGNNSVPGTIWACLRERTVLVSSGDGLGVGG